jgi:hypothetical protein
MRAQHLALYDRAARWWIPMAQLTTDANRGSTQLSDRPLGDSTSGIETRKEKAMVEQPTQAGSTVAPQEHPRQVVKSFTRYRDAENAVDQLASQPFDIERIAIIGSELQFVEEVKGRLNYGVAAAQGAAGGALAGALIGWILGLFDLLQPIITGLVLALHGVVLGAAVGAVTSLVCHALRGGRRDFQASGALRPRHYDVVADAAVVERARQLLGAHDTAPFQREAG